jgi:hypothetical protein
MWLKPLTRWPISKNLSHLSNELLSGAGTQGKQPNVQLLSEN